TTSWKRTDYRAMDGHDPKCATFRALPPTEVFPLFWNAIAILVKTSLNPKCKRSAADYEL
ncbi:hypothetical protein PMN34_07345, partial [Bifidobacterium pseudocatenulatum]|uniref:hypothetical protein n=1 Tax=Bifidobacterium pseudocatenulatum TaxID=28026 RepID=UPI0023313DAF